MILATLRRGETRKLKMPRDYKAMQLAGAAVRKARTPSRQLTEQIEKLAAKAPELDDQQFDTLARIVVCESARRVARRPIGPPAQSGDVAA